MFIGDKHGLSAINMVYRSKNIENLCFLVRIQVYQCKSTFIVENPSLSAKIYVFRLIIQVYRR